MDSICYVDGEWIEGNPKLTGPMNQAFWLGTTVFDGARAFDGCAPDVDQHCERLINSTRSLMMEPTMTAAEITELCLEGARKFENGAELYIRPMFYAAGGFLLPDPDTTSFVLAVYKTPMPDFSGMGVCLSTRRRPAREMAPTDAKASCLYPNTARALKEAHDRGFDNAVILDANGNVAEFATSNLWIVKDGIAKTPAVNGTFLNGVTRQRTIQLLREDGVEVQETTLTFADVMDADEVFSTGNYGKVTPVVRVEDRDLQRGPVTNKARDLYWDYSKTTSAL